MPIEWYDRIVLSEDIPVLCTWFFEPRCVHELIGLLSHSTSIRSKFFLLFRAKLMSYSQMIVVILSCFEYSLRTAIWHFALVRCECLVMLFWDMSIPCPAGYENFPKIRTVGLVARSWFPVVSVSDMCAEGTLCCICLIACRSAAMIRGHWLFLLINVSRVKRASHFMIMSQILMSGRVLTSPDCILAMKEKKWGMIFWVFHCYKVRKQFF